MRAGKIVWLVAALIAVLLLLFVLRRGAMAARRPAFEGAVFVLLGEGEARA